MVKRLFATLLLAFGPIACGGGGSGDSGSNDLGAIPESPPAGLQRDVPNAVGAAATFTTASTAAIDTANPFFKPLGNGRSCASCHDQNAGWSVTPATLRARFAASAGLDPVFRPVDGANAPNLPVGTEAERRNAYSMLLAKGLIRIGLPLPTGAEFALDAVDDPYGFASAGELSLFRRPLPTTNLAFNNTIMWDARETLTDPSPTSPFCVRGSNPIRCYQSTDASLARQANSAVTGHAESAAGLTTDEQRAIVDFETRLFTAQTVDSAAGSLSDGGATGGPVNLARNPFYFGINDFGVGDYRTGAAFTARVFTLFAAWQPPNPPRPPPNAQIAARESIARGERLFNNRPFTITNVRGFNDDLGRANVRGTCSSCHSTPNAGTHSVPRFMDTGVATAQRRTPDQPLYTLRNVATGETLQTTDPGAAMQSGKWADIGKMKVPSLRGLESRPPFFHDGSASDLPAVVRFYDRRFQMGLNPQEVADLAAFLRAL